MEKIVSEQENFLKETVFRLYIEIYRIYIMELLYCITLLLDTFYFCFENYRLLLEG